MRIIETLRDVSPIATIVDRRVKELGLSGMQELAKRAGISYATFYNLARGRKRSGGVNVVYKPSLKTLPALANALGLREDEVTYLFTVVSDDREFNHPHSPLYETIQTAMLQQYGMQEESLQEYAELNGICPEVLEAVFYGGKDSEGRLAQPPIGVLQAVALATGKSRVHFMALYAHHPDSNQMFFDKTDTNREHATALAYRMQDPTPFMESIEVRVAGRLSQEQKVNKSEELPLWVERRVARTKDLVAFRIRGDSMEGGKRPIFDGDLVIVDRKDKGRDGVLVVARLKDGSYICKMLRDDGSGRSLVSTNLTSTDSTPFYLPIEEVQEIEGRVIEVRRTEGTAS